MLRPLSMVGSGIPNKSRPLSKSYFFIVTLILAISSWGLSLVAQSLVTANIGNASIGILWFGIGLQTFIIFTFLQSLLSNTLHLQRQQLTTLASITIVLAAIGVDANLFSSRKAQKITAIGWLVTAIIDSIWVLYFTTERGTPLMKVFESLGAGSSGGDDETGSGLGIGGAMSVVDKAAGGGEKGYSEKPQGITQVQTNVDPLRYPPPSLGSAARVPVGRAPLDNVLGIRSNKQRNREVNFAIPSGSGSGIDLSAKGKERAVGEAAVTTALALGKIPSALDPVKTPTTTLSDIPPPTGVKRVSFGPQEIYPYKAEALHGYTGTPDDPTELSFKKGEVLEISNNSDQWWEARTLDGKKGIAPSNYLKVIWRVSSGMQTSETAMEPQESVEDRRKSRRYSRDITSPAAVAAVNAKRTSIAITSTTKSPSVSSPVETPLPTVKDVTVRESQEVYPYRAEALHPYNGAPEDPTELSFRKGELLDILTKSDLWWEARSSDGKKGIAPSNYLKIVWRLSSRASKRYSAVDQLVSGESYEAAREVKQVAVPPTSANTLVSEQQDVYPYKAEALHSYIANPEDTTELSFKKGDVLDILNNSEQWWEARTLDGKEGIVPSNYLKLLRRLSSGSIVNGKLAKAIETTATDESKPSITSTTPQPQEVYPYKAEALHTYTASSDDSTELSFAKGDILDILSTSEQWWEARTSNGRKGIAPSNYLKLLRRLSSTSSIDPQTKEDAAPPTGTALEAISTAFEIYPYKAEALHSYTGSSDDLTELSFAKGEILDILSTSEQWWEARTSDGRKGIAPSNYLRLSRRLSSRSSISLQTKEETTPATDVALEAIPTALEVYPYKAEALHSYAGSSDDSTELSFAKGEILDILSTSEQWWEARTSNGKKGIAPSNYLKLLRRLSSTSSIDLQKKEETTPTPDVALDVIPTALESYPFKAEALHSYAGSSDDSTELSFTKGEILDILSISEQWWEARTPTGIKGIAPSNYLKLMRRLSSASVKTSHDIDEAPEVASVLSNQQEIYPYKAEALHAYVGSLADPTELSFSKGEILEILTTSEQWWEARKLDGTKGVAPSNYLKLLRRLSSLSTLSETTDTMISPITTGEATTNVEPKEIYPYKAGALHAYAGSPDDQTELSFKKGEILDILNTSEQWWEARTLDGKKGIAPSNYLKLLRRLSSASITSTADEIEVASTLDETTVTTLRSVVAQPQEVYPYKAEALHAYAGSPDDSSKLSFAKGEILDILSTSEQWWEARAVNGTKGIAPSNYLKLMRRLSSISRTSMKDDDKIEPPVTSDAIISEMPIATVEIQEAYPFKAEALHAYTGSSEDSTELSFAKGEIMDVLNTSEQWWEARTLDGKKGIVPSNYLRLMRRLSSTSDVQVPESAEEMTRAAPAITRLESQEMYPFKAEALYDYKASPDDSTELSFAKGEILDIQTKSDHWWEARTPDGVKGIAPSNYLKLIQQVSTTSISNDVIIQPKETAPTSEHVPAPTLSSPTIPTPTPQVQEYPHGAEALYAYTGSPEDLGELSFAKGEVLDVHATPDPWWEAKTLDGRKGIVPSNYLKLLEPVSMLVNPDISLVEGKTEENKPVLDNVTLESQGQAFKAEALHGYTGAAEDPSELSFTAGEVLEIISMSEQWWEAKKLDGKTGIAPSNYLKLLPSTMGEEALLAPLHPDQPSVAKEEYPYKAEALYAYVGSQEDPTELSFAKGDVLEILAPGEPWWEARTSDGKAGLAPSNYLKLVYSPSDAPTSDVPPSSVASPSENDANLELEVYPYKAEALYAYTGAADDPTELSFAKGEVLDILTTSEQWWDARTMDGRKGVAPSNYLKLIVEATSNVNPASDTGDEVNILPLVAATSESTLVSYPYKAEALHAYTGSSEDPSELTFTKGEILDILSTSDQWWEARTTDGKTGIAPSNFLKFVEAHARTGSDIIGSTLERETVEPSEEEEELYPYRGEALHTYSSTGDDPTELSFRKGEILDILSTSDQWWEARTMDGRKGIVPSNYLKLVDSQESFIGHPYSNNAAAAALSDLTLHENVIPVSIDNSLASTIPPTLPSVTVTDPSESDDVYPYKAETLHAYSGASDDPNELSFAKGELLDIVSTSDQWWEARTMDGRKGIAPSNYLKLVESHPQASESGNLYIGNAAAALSDATLNETVAPTTIDSTLMYSKVPDIVESEAQEVRYRAEALHAYNGTSDDPSELSFKQGEVLEILDKSDQWWEARTMDGKKGIAPSNFLKVVWRLSSGILLGGSRRNSAMLGSSSGQPYNGDPAAALSGTTLHGDPEDEKVPNMFGIPLSEPQEPYILKAEALHTYTGTPDDPSELSFVKGEVLNILTNSDQWWEARTLDGRKGIAPSNYLKVLQ